MPWLHAIRAELKKFLPKDNDVLVFANILKADGLDAPSLT